MRVTLSGGRGGGKVGEKRVTACRCFVKRSFESSTRPRYRISGLQGIAVCSNWDRGGAAGRRLVNSIASVLLTFTRSFHLVKYLCRAFMVEVSRRAMVSVRHDCVKRAVSTAYSAS